MRIDVITLFPEIVLAPLRESIIGRAQKKGILELYAHNLRDWATDKRRTVDGPVYGGGAGMLLRPEPIFAAVEELRGTNTVVILLSPQGRTLTQDLAAAFKEETHLIFICGHYEGVDFRVVEGLVDLELSIGNYVLTNGAIAAAVSVDAIVRLLPDALGDPESSVTESFSVGGQIEAPAYTKPVDYKGMVVPEVLRSGNHVEIDRWRAEQGRLRTRDAQK